MLKYLDAFALPCLIVFGVGRCKKVQNKIDRARDVMDWYFCARLADARVDDAFL